MPAINSTFRSDEPALGDLLAGVGQGNIQLPDFQRGWVWDDIHIRSLIASISLSYPIGAVMLLQNGGTDVRFLARPIEGVRLNAKVTPEQLILDGQQRLTSLYLALCSGQPVPTKTEKGEKIRRHYYLDMAKCLDNDADRFDGVLSVPENRKITSDFGRKVDLDVSSSEKEYEQGLFPLSAIYDSDLSMNWRSGFSAYHEHSPEKSRFLMEFEEHIWQRFRVYKVPVIELLKDTPKEAVCQVFEKVNTGGVTLTVFELVTATFAADDFNLREDWEKRRETLQEHAVLQGVDATTFLTAVTLLATYFRHKKDGTPVSCKRRDVLRLQLSEYKECADQIVEGLLKAGRLLIREKVFDTKNLPYATQLIPLSTICAALGNKFDEDPVKQKLARWLWCGIFGEIYGGAAETRFAADVPEVLAWIEGGDDPRTLRDASFTPTRLLGLQTRNSAAYKGLMALLIKEGSHDFLSGDPIELTSYFDLAIDIHHIFPKAYCQKLSVAKELWNCCVNKAPLSARTNRIIGGNAPSSYLASLEKNHSVSTERLDEILASHHANPELVRSDDFEGFLRDRASRLITLIEQSMGKKVSGRDSEETVNAFGGPLN